MTKKKSVIVIGGGAAGMTAAIAAARNNAEVIILERMNRVGKKILATGNGRCNITNVHTDIKRFHGSNPKFAFGALGQFDVNQTIDFFEFLGVHCKVEEGGKVFPNSDQAGSVLDLLRFELQQLGVKEVLEAEVTRIKPSGYGFVIQLKDGTSYKGDSVIVATGGKASPALGSNGSGYGLVEALGHTIEETFPALVQLKLKSDFLKQVSGVKFIGEASLEADNKLVRLEGGEILFTDYGISGPPILQLSRATNHELMKKNQPWLQVDLFPQLKREELKELIELRLAYHPEKPLELSFVGLINKRLIPVVLKEAGSTNINKKAREVSEKEINNIVNLLKGWRFMIIGTQSWENAQVTAGGVRVSEIDAKTMESKLVPKLYIAGEIIDIDGDCGGFNLQWAWSSGYVAGENAAK